MKITKTKLQQALEIVKPGLATKEVIQQASSFVFTKGRVLTYNDEISISFPLDLDLEGAISGGNLSQLLPKIKKEDSEIEITTNEKEVLFTSGRIKAGFMLEEQIKLPLNDEISQKGKWKSLPPDFLKLLEFAIGACGRDYSREILTCVFVEQNGILKGADGFRATECSLSEKMPVPTFLFPAASAVEVIKMKPIKIAEGKGWIHFQTESEAIISCRILNEEYADISPILKVSKGIKMSFPRTITEVLERASVMAKQDHILDEEIKIVIEKNKFTVSSEANTSWYAEDVNFKYDGKKIEFAITPFLLKDIIKENKEYTFCENKLKFEGEGWIFVTGLRI